MSVMPGGPSACGCDACVVKVYACDLRTGIIRAVLVPVSMEFQSTLNEPGQGRIILPTDATLVRNIWPHLTSIYITVGGVPVFGGLVEEFAAESSENSASTTVLMKEIHYYLRYRHHDTTLTFNQVPQTTIGAALVNNSTANGIPLSGVAAGSSFLRDRVYPSWEKGILLERISQLTEVLDGPDYEVNHIREPDGWRTELVFRDQVGVVRDLTIISDVNASDYSLSVSADNHATHVHGIGAGEEEDQLEVLRTDPSGIYPRFDAAPAWKDVTNVNTLTENTNGYLDANKEPVATPAVTLIGCHDVAPDGVMVGDQIYVDVSQGAVTFRGPARVADISWKLQPNSQLTRELGLVPVGRASDSVLNQVPSDPCPDCGPDGGESP